MNRQRQKQYQYLRPCMDYVTAKSNKAGQTLVVVSMTIGIVALSVDFFILLVTQVKTGRGCRKCTNKSSWNMFLWEFYGMVRIFVLWYYRSNKRNTVFWQNSIPSRMTYIRLMRICSCKSFTFSLWCLKSVQIELQYICDRFRHLK